MLNYRSTGFELASIERMNLANIQGVRSDAYPLIRERRTTKKIGQIHTPYQEAQEWLISSLLLLNVPLRHTFVVVPRNHLIFGLLNLMKVRILLSRQSFSQSCLYHKQVLIYRPL